MVYDQENDKIGKGKFVPKWFGPLVKTVLKRGAYELVNYDGEPLSKIRNGLYLNKYFMWALRPHNVLLYYVVFHIKKIVQ